MRHTIDAHPLGYCLQQVVCGHHGWFFGGSLVGLSGDYFMQASFMRAYVLQKITFFILSSFYFVKIKYKIK